MSAPNGSKITQKGRLYDWRGEKFWSVTTVLDALPKPALMYWAAKLVAEFSVKNLEVLQNLVDHGDTVGAIQLAKGAPNRDRDKKADVGTAVHEAVEALILDKPLPDWDSTVAKHMDHFLQFVKDWDVTFEASEAQVYNRAERYAGTFDFTAIIPRLPDFGYAGPRCLGDVKTGKGIYPEVGLQLAAYAHGEFIGLPNGTEVPNPKYDVGAALHLRPGGYKLVPARIDDDIFLAFKYVREVWRFINETADDVLGVPLTSEAVA